MSRDVGPNVEMAGPKVWVPRTVRYLEARRIAKEAMQNPPERLRYLGKTDALLMGFVRDCLCEEVCERRWLDDEDTGDRTCDVPAWAFEIEERW